MSPLPRRRRPSPLLVVPAVLLVTTACGGGAAGAAGTTSEPAAAGAVDPTTADTADRVAAGAPGTVAPAEASEAAEAPEAPEAPQAPSPAGPADVPDLLDFTAATVSGGTFDGASLAGTPTLLWFWAPWCTVCAREAPEVAELAAEYEGRAEVVGVAGLSGDAEAMTAFVERGGLQEVVHVADLDGTVYTRFGVASQYDSVVLDADGEARLVTGPVPVDRLRDELDALLGEG